MKKLLALCLMLNIFMIGFTACSGGGSTGDTVANTAALPRISPQGGTYHGAIDITIFTSTGNAVIRYTTDGTEPTESNGSVYSGPVRVTGNTTIRAIACAEGIECSAVVEADFTILQPEPQRLETPRISPSPGVYSTPTTITISGFPAGATVRYTTDGSAPSHSNGSVYSAPFSVNASTTVKAIACMDGAIDSDIASAEYEMKAAAPTFSPTARSFYGRISVTLASTTPGATIRYTVDGSTPTAQNGIVYNGAITLTESATIKAIAVRQGWTDSSVSSASYTWLPYGQAAAPVFSPGSTTCYTSRTVTMTTSTGGAVIRYTIDGTEPTRTSGNVYSGPITISRTTELRAIAVKDGWTDSGITSARYTFRVYNPRFSPVGATYNGTQEVSIISSTEGVTIRYTTDGSEPSRSNGITYTGAFTVSSAATVKAIALKDGFDDSDVITAVYTMKAGNPVFAPAPGGSFTAPTRVSLRSSTPGATIIYTTDGTAPSRTNGTVYSSAFTVSSPTTIRAFAYYGDWTDSDAVTGEYIIRAAAPAFTPSPGHYDDDQEVEIVTTTAGAVIRYTTDGTTPTPISGEIYTGPIHVSQTTVIKAIAYRDGLACSSVSRGTFALERGPLAVTILQVGGRPYTPFMTVRTEEITGIVYTVTNGEGNCYFASSHVDAGQTVDMTNRWFENHDNNPECYLSIKPPAGKTGTWTVELQWRDSTTWPWNSVYSRVYLTVVD